MKVLFGVDPTVVFANGDQPYEYGDLYLLDGHAGLYEFGQADEIIDAGEHAIIDHTDGGMVLATTALVGATPKTIGVACADLAALEWGFIWRGCSRFEAIVVNAVAANAQLTTTTTAGAAGTGGDILAGYRTIDAGVTATRTTVEANTLLYAGV